VQRNGTGQVIGIVEAATGEGLEDSPAEINGGAYCFSAPWLWEHLPQVEASPVGEVYLTALASMNSEGNASINAVKIARANDLQGVNNRVQLAQVEAELRQRINQRWMLDGVTIFDPASVFIDAEVTIGQDAVILPNTMLLGRTTVGEESEIGPGSVLRDSSVGNRCRVTTSVLEDAVMEDGANIGPFSHLRSGAYLESGVHIGNFAEIKESRLAVGSLMGHFGYIGDASIGANVNLGAGMVTCNYDGREKHRTNIGAGVFIGCDTMLVAPVTVGDDAVTGAGSVITEDVPQGRLAVGVPARIVVRKSDNT
jgi:bifunctional UDP-N-acetylglucosamine pyrophosphorylase/glucosamine-1-phosphate N-acetyltransferase